MQLSKQQLEEMMEEARTYTGLEAKPCPLCEFKDGVLIKECSMHTKISKLSQVINIYENALSKIAKGDTEKGVTTVTDAGQWAQGIAEKAMAEIRQLLS